MKCILAYTTNINITERLDMVEHPAVTCLKKAAKLKGIKLHKMPGGHFALYRKTKSPNSFEAIGSWMKFHEVMCYFGATDKITLRQALEHDGITWPNK